MSIAPERWADYSPTNLERSPENERMMYTSLECVFPIVVDLRLCCDEENGSSNYIEPYVVRLDPTIPVDLGINNRARIYEEFKDASFIFKDRDKLTAFAQGVIPRKTREFPGLDEPKWDDVKEIMPLAEPDLAIFRNKEEHDNKTEYRSRKSPHGAENRSERENH